MKHSKLLIYGVCSSSVMMTVMSAPAPVGGEGQGSPTKIDPLGGAYVARVFPNVSLTMCPLKLFHGPNLL